MGQTEHILPLSHLIPENGYVTCLRNVLDIWIWDSSQRIYLHHGVIPMTQFLVLHLNIKFKYVLSVLIYCKEYDKAPIQEIISLPLEE
jgi:hypothetical protein